MSQFMKSAGEQGGARCSGQDGSGDQLGDVQHVAGELNALLSALRLMTEAARVLHAFNDQRLRDASFGAALAEACPGWRTWTECEPHAAIAALAWAAHERGQQLGEVIAASPGRGGTQVVELKARLCAAAGPARSDDGAGQ